MAPAEFDGDAVFKAPAEADFPARLIGGRPLQLFDIERLLATANKRARCTKRVVNQHESSDGDRLRTDRLIRSPVKELSERVKAAAVITRVAERPREIDGRNVL